MTHIRQILISCLTALLVLCMTACGDRQLRERLDTVERIATDHPDSALTLLAAVPDPSRLATADRARYDLLMAEARYMADSIDTVPTRLLEVAEYFDRKGDSHNAARAYYYAGIQTRQKGDPGQAIISFLKAEKRAEKNDDTLFLGKIYRAIADSYDDNMDYASALTFYKNALNCFVASNDTTYTGYAFLDVARACYSISDTTNSEKYAIKALEFGKEHAIDNLIAVSSRHLIQHYIEQKRFNDAIQAFTMLDHAGHSFITYEDYRNLGIAYYMIGDASKAEYYNNILKQNGYTDRILDFHLSRHYGDFKKALEIYTENISEQNDAVERIWHRQSARLISDYYKIEEEKYEAVHKKQTLLWIMFTLILFFITAVVLLANHIRIRRIKASNEISLIQIERFKQDIEAKEENIRNLFKQQNESQRELEEIRRKFVHQLETGELASSEKRDFLEEQFSLVCKLTEIIDNDVKDQTRLNKLINKIRGYLKDFSSETSIANLEKSIDTHLSDLISNFKNDFPEATYNERTIFIFSILRFSPPAIAFIFGINTGTVYNRRSRLKAKFENSPKPRAKLYLQYL